jgi:hypothetical protein
MKIEEMHELVLKSGGPAYPGQIMNDDRSHYAFLGMTIRDHFAGQVIASMTKDNMNVDPAPLARRAYQIADAMIEARKADWNKDPLRNVRVG